MENGNLLQYSCSKNSMGKGTWKATYSPRGLEELDMTESDLADTVDMLDQ